MPVKCKSNTNQHRHFCMSLRTIQCSHLQSWVLLLPAVEALTSEMLGAAWRPAYCQSWPRPRILQSLCRPSGRCFSEFGMLLHKDKGEAGCHSFIKSSAREMSNLTIYLCPQGKKKLLALSPSVEFSSLWGQLLSHRKMSFSDWSPDTASFPASASTDV